MKFSRADLMTTPEIARKLGVTPQYIYREIAERRLVAIRIAKHLFVPRSEFERWAEEYEFRRRMRSLASPVPQSPRSEESLSDEVQSKGKSHENSKSRVIPATQG